MGLNDESTNDKLAIYAIHEGQVRESMIKYESNIDSISITHDAKVVEGFALGRY